MAIGSDFTIDYVNKRVYHSANSEIYTVNEFYSWLMNEFDDASQMDDDVPISAQTPTEYTLINGWFVDDTSMQYLKGGAIKTSGYLDEIRVIEFNVAAYTSAVPTDITKAVTGTGGDTGTLLAYNNTTRKWWVRMDDSGDTFATSEIVEMTTGGGTGTGTSKGASVTGEDLFANIYTLGTIETSPESLIYIFQNEERLSEWWDRSTFDLETYPEHVDLLIKVKEAGTEIAAGVITVFSRQYGDLFDHFEIDLTAGGRNAVPLATAPDLNNTTGELFLSLASSTNFDVGNFVRGVTSGAIGEIVLISTNDVYLGNVVGTFQTSETINETSDGTAAGDLDGTTTNDATTPFTNVVAGYGGAGNILIYHVSGSLTYDTGNIETPVLYETVTGGTNGATGIVLSVSNTGGWTGTGTGAIILGNVSGSFADNETLTFSSSGSTMTVNDLHGLDPTVVTVDRNFSLQSSNAYSTVIDLNGANVDDFYEFLKYSNRESQSDPLYPYASKIRQINFVLAGYTDANEDDIGRAVTGATTTDTGTLLSYNNTTREWQVLMDVCSGTPANDDLFDEAEIVSVTGGTGTGTTIGASSPGVVEGQEYIRAFPTYALVKASPFGTFAGGTYFGAQGVWIEDMHADDGNSYSLLDHSGTTQTPPASIQVKMTSVESGDKIVVFASVGDTYEVNKNQYNVYEVISSGASYIRVTHAVDGADAPNDTPTSGIIRVVRRTAAGIIIGEERYSYTDFDTTNASYTDFNLSGVTTAAYGTDDTAYVPYMDETSTGTSVTVTVQFVENRYVVARVRRYNGSGDSIIPFQTKGQILNTGYSPSAIRTDDGIVN